jgi:hypothetical protein
MIIDAPAAPASRTVHADMADAQQTDTKPPAPKQEGTVISLIVKDQSNSEVHFKVKSHTRLEKVGGAFS